VARAVYGDWVSDKTTLTLSKLLAYAEAVAIALAISLHSIATPFSIGSAAGPWVKTRARDSSSTPTALTTSPSLLE
jgi:hypothetical protein